MGEVEVIKFPKKKRKVDPRHLKRIRALECCVCGWPDSQAHHLIATGEEEDQRGMGYKVGDDRTIPLCEACHRELHMRGVETWEALFGKQTDHLDRLKKRGFIK